MNLMTVFFLQGRKYDVDYADSHVRYHVFLYDSSAK